MKITKENPGWKTEERKKEEVSGNSSTDSVTPGLDQITKFVYRLDGPLGEGNV